MRLRLARITCLVLAAALAVPFVQPSAVIGRDENPREKGSGAVSGALIVRLRAGVARTEMASVLSRAGATELASMDDPSSIANPGMVGAPGIGAASAERPAVHIVSVPAARRNLARQLLQVDPRVATVEDDATADAAVIPSDPYWGQQWNARRVRASEAWEVTRGDSGVIIAIVDTGVDGNHPDLRGRMVRGWEFPNDDSNPYDDDGHGTAVATTAAAAGNDRVGIAGMCWRCRIMPVKVLNGEGHGSHSNIAAGVIWAANQGADVINMSIAGLSSTTLLGQAIAYALRKGAIVAAAAGNDGTSRRSYPGAYSGVISVAATNNVDRLYSWSTRGSWVTLAAPGCVQWPSARQMGMAVRDVARDTDREWHARAHEERRAAAESNATDIDAHRQHRQRSGWNPERAVGCGAGDAVGSGGGPRSDSAADANADTVAHDQADTDADPAADRDANAGIEDPRVAWDTGRRRSLGSGGVRRSRPCPRAGHVVGHR
ncbi:MAG: S8 family serine peptidase [Candidatus Limnocylindrales bacterium]